MNTIISTLPSNYLQQGDKIGNHGFAQQQQQQCIPKISVPLNYLPDTAPPTPYAEKSLDQATNASIPPRAVARKAKASVIPPPPPFAVVHEGSMMEQFKVALDGIDLEFCEENGENAFYVCDLAEVYRQFVRWEAGLGGRVKPFFAVKCNPDPQVVRLLANLGANFDCASHAEIALVLSLGVSPDRIIYANPCKAASFIRHAHSANVRLMTFDNAEELSKVAKYHPTAQMVLRILTDDSGSLCRFGDKFGAPLAEARALLEKAKALGVNVVGVSFHVGSGCSNPDLYVDAVGRAKYAFDLAEELGFHFDFLDVGGGFGHDNFERLAAGLLKGLDQYFPVGCGVKVVAEPGRYFVAEAFELATNVIARRGLGEMEQVMEEVDKMEVPVEEKPLTLYYINDGVYGAFNCIMFDHQLPQPQVLTLGGVFQGAGLAAPNGTQNSLLPTPAPSEASDMDMSSSYLSISSQIDNVYDDLQGCKIFGPSCDSIDMVCAEAFLPVKRLDVGDWLRWKGMGAYTVCAASQFNGFKISEVRYTIDGKGVPGVVQTIKALVSA